MMIYSSKAKGDKGEQIACEFLQKNGFRILARNYLKKWGEIDVVAEKDKIIQFFEVKSISADFDHLNKGHRPEDNVHNLKLRRLRRTIETYLSETGRGLDAEFLFHVLCVFMDSKKQVARVKWIENVIL